MNTACISKRTHEDTQMERMDHCISSHIHRRIYIFVENEPCDTYDTSTHTSFISTTDFENTIEKKMNTS